MSPLSVNRRRTAVYKRSLIGLLTALVITAATYYSGGCIIQRDGLYFNCSKEK